MSDASVGYRIPASNRADWLVLFLLSLSLATNVVLAVSVMRLAGRSSPSTAPAREPLRAGVTLPALSASAPDGQRVKIAFGPADSLPTLLYVFAPDCRWCAKNATNMRAVFDAARATHRIVALSLTADVGSEMGELPSHVRVLVQPNRETFEAYHLGPTPMTVVVSPTGRVTKVWTGAFEGQSKKEVEGYFAVKLADADAAAH